MNLQTNRATFRLTLMATCLLAGAALGLVQALTATDLAHGAAAPRRPAQDTWRVNLAAFPDTVGVGGYACSGCDLRFSAADDMAAAAQPLQPLEVVIHKLGDRREVYWHGTLNRDRAANQSLTDLIYLTAPPPYQVTLLTQRPLGYTLCPNAPASVILRQSDFDAAGNVLPGSGRGAKVSWYFWSCRLPSD